MTPLVFLLVAAPAPPVLTEPAPAREWARSDGIPPLTAVETLLFARDASGALDRLLETEVAKEDPRRIRLELDAFVERGNARLGADRADQLETFEGWGVHARVQRKRLEQISAKRTAVRIALILFSMCLAALALGGARELLRLSGETVVFAAAVVIGVVVVRSGSAPLAAILALPGAGTIALVHAAGAAARRTAPTVRGRLLMASLVVLGTAGVFFAIGAQIGPAHILALLSG